jgi:hypothetical protein
METHDLKVARTFAGDLKAKRGQAIADFDAAAGTLAEAVATARDTTNPWRKLPVIWCVRCANMGRALIPLRISRL